MSNPQLRAELRSALYHRLHWLWPILAKPAVRRGVRMLGWGLFVAWLAFVVLVLALRYVVLPKVGDYLSEIEQAATRAVGQTVSIGRVEARWQGLNPDLVLDDVRILDRQGGLAFSLARVESVLSWQSLWRLRPTLSLLAFEGPVLQVRRDTSGRISVAGMAAEGESDPAFAEWVLEQRRIRIRNATIVWDDRLRQAPPLILEDLQFALDNSGSRHRFGLSAAPPDELAARIDIRGEVKGDLGDALDSLSGKVFVQLDYADLAGWRSWVDYPLRLPQGRGALRVWGDLEDGGGKLTADVALEELRIGLGSKLPELDLASLRGRLEGRYRPGVWAVVGRKLELLTQQGVRVAPTDFQVEWRRNPQTATVSGSASASFLDFSALASLAAYMPLDERSRELLQKHQPQGRISELRASWGLEGEALKRYSLKAGFAQLGILPGGYFPGANGLSGSIDLTEKGGELLLDAGPSGLSLPAVFPEPDIAFDSLKARTTWKTVGASVDIKLEKLDFAGPDAAGSARGTYRFTGDGPGEIDLVAHVDRADGRAVWRYMPHAVNADARAWIRRGIVAGRGYDGRLVLQGNLKDFPFRDGRGGKFIVTAKAADAKVDYAPGWPVIDNIAADMTFGVGMKIAASQGGIFGAKLSDVTVEIPDFESHEEMLLVRGLAQGPTSEFFRFIDHSPVADSIDRFTEGMKASGNGRLDLELDIPLRHALDTKVRGDYRFQNNQLQPLAGLPPLTQVNGRLSITENSVSAQDISGKVFGGPLKVQVRNVGDKVGVLASGTANMADVSSHFGWPLINHLTGRTGWKADISIRKRNADIVVESDLLGISSPLPEPLNKNATMPLPLRIERSAPDATREQYRITLGKVAQGLIIRQQGNWERGVFAVGEAEPRLPDKGLAVRVATPKIDADAWKNFLPEGAASPDGSASPGAANGGGLGLNVVTLKTPQLHLMGRDYSQVDVSLRPRDTGWQIGLNTREAVGDVFWRSSGEGWVEGNFKRLIVRPAAEVAEGSTTLINSLPGMSLVVDDFRIGEKALGKLELKARNDKGAWNLDLLSLQNPDGALKGKGVWNNTGKHQTRMDFELTAKDVGKLLERLGYVDAVRRGTAKLSGDLQWNGPLTGIDYPSLTGQMTVNAEKGQFNKLEPGVGKLLGLISLQSLPRRLTLDFRDIFSDGLAFDSIEGKLAVKKGVMRTNDPLRIKGPAAQIEIQGETDLKAETQDMQVVVRPEIGNAAAMGAALVNPVVGAATLLANAVLQNPLSRLFSYRYHVTGSWSDPQVDKAGESPPQAKPKNEGESKP
ncbi:YhdP family protein [Dechloromonas denitrificans]|uniref:YhdP family protein n=1 Tax=Dechloromonas denitrificans TaxID=281362 RepID=UPI001CF88C66|nr:YhdP family protein [Dechloromonas denitrificans]UCV04713.1 TIGR02099 family protein [Dechloromonas denitrificans]